MKARVIKTDNSSNILWNNQYFDNHLGQIENCLFGMDIATDGGILIAGNNDLDDEDYEMIKIYNDCESNVTYDISDPSGTINITTNTHWNNNHKVIGEVVINAGKTLTIDNNAVIEFADSKLTGIPTGITVNQGGHLIVNTAILTSIQACPNAMWDGVIAIGNRTTPQNTTQGIVFMTGNVTHPSTISNARIGLLLGYNGSAHTINQGGGSFARCIYSTFLNNNIDVQSVPYTSPNNPNVNLTYFGNCTFTSNNVLNDPSYIDLLGNQRTTLEHVYLNGVNGVNFNNCKFFTDLSGSLSTIITDDRSYGIYSTDSKFTITGPNPIPATPTNTFQNLRYGIYATATNPVNTYSVSYTDFTNCFAGIYQNNINYSNVTFNQFRATAAIPGVSFLKGCIFNPNIANCRQYFYYLNQCKGYVHQENKYAVTVNSQNIWGTVFNGSPGANLSYRNTYAGVTHGTQAQAGNSGLSVQCHTYTPSSVTLSSDISVTSGAIANPQGNCFTINGPAGNIFDHSASDILVSTGVPSFVYNYFNDAADMPNTTANYIPTACSGLPKPANACPTNYLTPVNPCAGLPPGACRLAVVDSLNNLIKTTELPIKQGEAKDLYNKINSVTTANINSKNKVSNVESALLAKSPYLSDSVLFTLLRHTPQFPQSLIAAIIIANSPVSIPVLAVVDSLSLQSSLQTQIINAQTGVSARSQLKQQLVALYYEKENELNLAISEILLTNPGANVNNRVFNLLTKDSTANNKIEMIYFATANGDNSVAQSLIDSLINVPGMRSIAKMQQYNLNLTQSKQTWASALQSNPAMKQDIMSIAADSTQLGYAPAAAALTSAYGTPSYEYIEGIQTSNSSRVAQPQTTESINTKVRNNSVNEPNNFWAYPNPTNGMLTINYLINEPTCTDATLQLIEMGTGRILLTKKVPCNSTQTQIDLNEFANGVYSLSIQSNLNAPKIIRIVKIH